MLKRCMWLSVIHEIEQMTNYPKVVVRITWIRDLLYICNGWSCVFQILYTNHYIMGQKPCHFYLFITCFGSILIIDCWFMIDWLIEFGNILRKKLELKLYLPQLCCRTTLQRLTIQQLQLCNKFIHIKLV